MSRIFTGPIDIADAGTDADQNVWELIAGSGDKVRLHGFQLTSNVVAAAALKFELVRISAAGTGGTAITEEDINESENATATATLTSDVETPGTQIAVLKNWYWEQLGPLDYLPTPEMQPTAEVTNGFALRLLTNPTNAAFGGYVVWEEL